MESLVLPLENIWNGNSKNPGALDFLMSRPVEIQIENIAEWHKLKKPSSQPKFQTFGK